ncbi:FIG01023059: hypothetical protein [hydrothermal vent metagenome]|uniref:Excalibur calcium-binding domain-containing protein n=1 Tax=hydrothermal vent metagenome TaxID=652676 RepID=A0A3B0S1H5_9ZZZZ
MRYILAVVALTGLAACETLPPASKSGVGFGNYDQYQKEQTQRKAQSAGAAGAALPAPDAVSGETLEPAQSVGQPAVVAQPQTQVQPQSKPETDLAAATQTALNSTPTPDNPGISDENDFDAVGSRRTIESDKERMARIKENYKVIAPQALPKRSGSTGPNIVDYALRSKHPVGTQIYKRVNLGGASKYARGCGKFASPDLAQIQFLAKGGPQRDKLGLDPDGDGFACAWDPAPFRKAAGG